MSERFSLPETKTKTGVSKPSRTELGAATTKSLFLLEFARFGESGNATSSLTACEHRREGRTAMLSWQNR